MQPCSRTIQAISQISVENNQIVYYVFNVKVNRIIQIFAESIEITPLLYCDNSSINNTIKNNTVYEVGGCDALDNGIIEDIVVDIYIENNIWYYKKLKVELVSSAQAHNTTISDTQGCNPDEPGEMTGAWCKIVSAGSPYNLGDCDEGTYSKYLSYIRTDLFSDLDEVPQLFQRDKCCDNNPNCEIENSIQCDADFIGSWCVTDPNTYQWTEDCEEGTYNEWSTQNTNGVADSTIRWNQCCPGSPNCNQPFGNGYWNLQPLPVTLPLKEGYCQQLFDKSSWSNVNIGIGGTTLSSLLDDAADRWSKYIKFNANIYNTIIANEQAAGRVWKGIKLVPEVSGGPLIGNQVGIAAASSRPHTTKNLPGIKANTISFILNVNMDFANQLARREWYDAITHELGHALGIASYWKEAFSGVPYINEFIVPSPDGEPILAPHLDGNVYINAMDAYNEIRLINARRLKRMPLAVNMDETSRLGHLYANAWEATPWPDAPNEPVAKYTNAIREIMSTGVDVGNQVISKISIGFLEDFGYEKVNDGADNNEGDPVRAVAQSIIPNSSISTVACGCCQNDIIETIKFI